MMLHIAGSEQPVAPQKQLQRVLQRAGGGVGGLGLYPIQSSSQPAKPTDRVTKRETPHGSWRTRKKWHSSVGGGPSVKRGTPTIHPVREGVSGGVNRLSLDTSNY